MTEQESKFKIITTTITTITAVVAVTIGGIQLENFKIQLQEDAKRRAEERTLQLAVTYLTNPHLIEIARNIKNGAIKQDVNGKTLFDYSSLESNSGIKSDVFNLLNYFNLISNGIRNGVYSESIARDNFERLFIKSVQIFILGESGKMDCSEWKAGSKLASEKTFPDLVFIYNKWLPEFKKEQDKNPCN